MGASTSKRARTNCLTSVQKLKGDEKIAPLLTERKSVAQHPVISVTETVISVTETVISVTGTTDKAITLLISETRFPVPLLLVVEYALPTVHNLTVSRLGSILCVGGSNGPEALCNWRVVTHAEKLPPHRNLETSRIAMQHVQVFGDIRVQVFGDIVDMPGVAIDCRMASTARWVMHYSGTVTTVVASHFATVSVTAPIIVFPHIGSSRNDVAVREDWKGHRHVVCVWYTKQPFRDFEFKHTANRSDPLGSARLCLDLGFQSRLLASLRSDCGVFFFCQE
jgi:hypothetical protein